MTKRKALSKQTRFEVFKRDGFKCQYCGATAPDVVLHVDHIQPVSKGGENDLLNLVTACNTCNAGKSNILISDDAAILKQRTMLDELNERREQLEMMLRWREGMKDLGLDQLDALTDEWAELVSPFALNETGIKAAKKLLREFGLNVVLNALTIAEETYVKRDEEGKPTADTVNFAWSKVGGIAKNLTRPDIDKQIYYIRGICRNRFNYCNEGICISLLRRATKAGADLDELADMARSERNWTGWTNAMYDLLERLED